MHFVIINDFFTENGSINANHFYLDYLQTSEKSRTCNLNRGSYMSAHVLLNLLIEFRKRDKMRGLPSI